MIKPLVLNPGLSVGRNHSTLASKQIRNDAGFKLDMNGFCSLGSKARKIPVDFKE